MRRLACTGALALLALAPAAQAWTWPASGPVLRPFTFGVDPYSSGQHRGIDVSAPADAVVPAPASGTVTFAGSVPTSGRSVTIQTADGYAVTLTHLGALLVMKGVLVAEGEGIGTIGPSGVPEVPEPYVHLGVRVAADPQGYVNPLSAAAAPGCRRQRLAAPPAEPARPRLLPRIRAGRAPPPAAPPAEPVPAPAPAPAPFCPRRFARFASRSGTRPPDRTESEQPRPRSSSRGLGRSRSRRPQRRHSGPCRRGGCHAPEPAATRWRSRRARPIRASSVAGAHRPHRGRPPASRRPTPVAGRRAKARSPPASGGSFHDRRRRKPPSPASPDRCRSRSRCSGCSPRRFCPPGRR